MCQLRLAPRHTRYSTYGSTAKEYKTRACDIQVRRSTDRWSKFGCNKSGQQTLGRAEQPASALRRYSRTCPAHSGMYRLYCRCEVPKAARLCASLCKHCTVPYKIGTYHGRRYLVYSPYGAVAAPMGQSIGRPREAWRTANMMCHGTPDATTKAYRDSTDLSITTHAQCPTAPAAMHRLCGSQATCRLRRRRPRSCSNEYMRSG